MRKILIVGASSGIGMELAKMLTAQEISVISASRRKPSIDIGHIPLDARSDDPFPPFSGPLDGLVYCPGTILLRPFKLLKISDFKDDLETNLFGAIRVINHYLAALRQSSEASIVLFSSVAASIGMPYHTSVAASKGAIEGFARSLAAELAPTIRVNVIAPSLVDTPLASRLVDSDAKLQIASSKHPLKKIGQVKDIAAMAAFLLSPNASWITGQILHVDGGISTLKP